MADTYVVKQGDTLGEIAQRFLGSATKYKELAAINNISNPNLIYVGQVIKLTAGGSSSGGSSGGSQTTPQVQSMVRPSIRQFGLLSGTDRTLFAMWSWDKVPTTAAFQVKWEYVLDGLTFVGKSTQIPVDKYDRYASQEDTWDHPENATKVTFKVLPISETIDKGGSKKTHWSAQWSSISEATYYPEKSPPKVPSRPSVSVKDNTLTAKLENLDLNADGIQFQVVRDDKYEYKKSPIIPITTSQATFSCSVMAGSEYKVRCRSHRDGMYSEWSDYSDNSSTSPSAPSKINVCKATSETSVYLEWPSIKSATSYEIEYATDKKYFDGSDKTTTVPGIEFAHYEKTGLEAGQEYFFRVRAVNSAGNSAWSQPVSVIIGKAPEAPTTWSSTTTVTTGETLYLYWIHNTEDGSSQVSAILELITDGHKETISVKNSTDEDEKDKTSVYEFDTSGYDEGTVIQWRVRTCGITGEYGDWSIQRTVTVYAPASLGVVVTDQKGVSLDTIESFPFYIRATSGPRTQIPVSYHVVITANESYETTDRVGNAMVVSKGGEVYSKHFDMGGNNNPYELVLELSAGHVDLQNNIGYTITCTVAMDSGLVGEDSAVFNVSWSDRLYSPNASIGFDPDTLVTYIRPYCKDACQVIREVSFSNGVYSITDTVLPNIFGNRVKNAVTPTGEQVYFGITVSDGDNGELISRDVYYCYVEEGALIDGITLSVYRREFDGSFTELITGVDNMSNVTITDPHPALDYARYRIVAVENSTGSVSYTDLPGYPINEKAIIIQWDEEWSNFDATNEDALVQPPWSGSLLKLPYNIDVSDNYSPDVEKVEYIGRKHPVSYYGTQTGTTATWNVDIRKDDIETLYALRRLAVWMGDVYVREPSGSGYWANIVVSFSQKHCELIIPVTLNITRVAGGV